MSINEVKPRWARLLDEYVPFLNWYIQYISCSYLMDVFIDRQAVMVRGGGGYAKIKWEGNQNT